MMDMRTSLKCGWYSHAPLRWGSPSPHFVMKRQALRRLLDSVAPRTVLDVGCDTGLYGYMASEVLPSVQVLDGFDVNPEAVGVAQRLQRRGRPGVCYRHWVGDIDHEVLDGTYDLVLYIDSIVYASDPGSLLRQITDHLARDGRVILYAPVSDGISVRVPEGVRARLPDWSTVCHGITREDLLGLLESSGLRVMQVVWVGKYGYRLFKTWEYWLRSYSILAAYLCAPIGWAFAAADGYQAGRGSGVFVVASADGRDQVSAFGTG